MKKITHLNEYNIFYINIKNQISKTKIIYFIENDLVKNYRLINNTLETESNNKKLK